MGADLGRAVPVRGQELVPHRRPGHPFAAFLATAAVCVAVGFAGAGCSVSGQLDMRGFSHSSEVRARDGVARNWLRGQFELLRDARGWLRPVATAVADLCSTTSNETGFGQPNYEIVYCYRNVERYYRLSGDISNRTGRLELIFGRAGWLAFRSLSSQVKAPNAVALPGRASESPARYNTSLVFMWIGRRDLPVLRRVLAQIGPPPRADVGEAGVLDIEHASLADVRGALSASKYVLVVEIAYRYFQAQGKGKWPSPPR